MKTNFQVVALPRSRFESLFALGDSELAAKGARRMIVDSKPGFPCRIGLIDAEIGETVILLPFVHHDVDSPYRGSGAIFVRENAAEANLAVGEIPRVVSSRTMSVRAYDEDGMMVACELIPGAELKLRIEELFANSKISYLHLHNAGAGCYSCKVERA